MLPVPLNRAAADCQGCDCLVAGPSLGLRYKTAGVALYGLSVYVVFPVPLIGKRGLTPMCLVVLTSQPWCSHIFTVCLLSMRIHVKFAGLLPWNTISCPAYKQKHQEKALPRAAKRNSKVTSVQGVDAYSEVPRRTILFVPTSMN